MKCVKNPLKPIYNEFSEILILGTMPSVKSREIGFYYMHPQNRFWLCLEKVFNKKIGSSINEKKNFLLKHKIALWDVLDVCDIKSSRDESISNFKVNDIKSLIDKTNIKKVFTTGKKASLLYRKYIYPTTLIEDICLYSPSPANCKYHLDEIVENYQVINK